ncbi:MAG: hypothetical protein AVO34_09265 [Firmicutes bacterium ML8_F2]|nr:MAG: hypothetical protein AVO34_09265 [Firmicutes bacterium ML8_F2]
MNAIFNNPPDAYACQNQRYDIFCIFDRILIIPSFPANRVHNMLKREPAATGSSVNLLKE